MRGLVSFHTLKRRSTPRSAFGAVSLTICTRLNNRATKNKIVAPQVLIVA